MIPDPRDPLLQPRREPMTAWERGLRPRAERHWLLWLALAVLLVFVAWRGAEWLLLAQPSRSARPSSPPPAVRLPTVPPPAATDVAPEVGNRRVPPAESYSVTKCLGAAGVAAYSDGPCPAGSRATTVWVQPDLNLADGMSPAEREASMRNNSVVAAQVQQHERRVAQNTGGDVVGECSRLDQHIKGIDAMARQPQSAPTQDWLASEKRAARDRQFRLACR